MEMDQIGAAISHLIVVSTDYGVVATCSHCYMQVKMISAKLFVLSTVEAVHIECTRLLRLSYGSSGWFGGYTWGKDRGDDAHTDAKAAKSASRVFGATLSPMHIIDFRISSSLARAIVLCALTTLMPSMLGKVPSVEDTDAMLLIRVCPDLT